MRLTLEQICQAVNGQLLSGNMSDVVTCVGIDARHSIANGLFIAICGAHFDGHDFIADAKEKGAIAAIVHKDVRASSEMAIIRVNRTEVALGDLAQYWRNQFNVECIGITGSNGKSTTKEMISAAAKGKGNVLATTGNFNNLIGLPLTTFGLNDTHDISIFEMGMNRINEIKRLAEIAKPSIGVITNVTAAHLEHLQTVDAVAKAKFELFEAIPAQGYIIVNKEDELISKLSSDLSCKKITFGMQNNCDVQFLNMSTDGLNNMALAVNIFGKTYETVLPVPGTHNVMNAMAAIGACLALNVDECDIMRRLSGFTPMTMRFERVQLANGVCVVNDSYNANPESVLAALRTVGAAKRAGDFIVVLGDMLELGKSASMWHQRIGEESVQMGADYVYALGEFSCDIIKGSMRSGLNRLHAKEYSNVSSIRDQLLSQIKVGDIVLIKGSRGMRMERIVDDLKHMIGMG